MNNEEYDEDISFYHQFDQTHPKPEPEQKQEQVDDNMRGYVFPLRISSNNAERHVDLLLMEKMAHGIIQL